ncbi:voltage-dependent anion-selective channel [Anaeramoeba flamelloides]|uniref:Voltage-dependent anion-selective channel n=1 Tax=Anaeramoeba flamelloides TaxID=1746091 RepID=A0ABQ8XPK5_9EUKA|nr:voltage-dependent anion-selective channel [Anaeramoeba flamelloides]
MNKLPFFKAIALCDIGKKSNRIHSKHKPINLLKLSATDSSGLDLELEIKNVGLRKKDRFLTAFSTGYSDENLFSLSTKYTSLDQVFIHFSINNIIKGLDITIDAQDQPTSFLTSLKYKNDYLTCQSSYNFLLGDLQFSGATKIKDDFALGTNIKYNYKTPKTTFQFLAEYQTNESSFLNFSYQYVQNKINFSFYRQIHSKVGVSLLNSFKFGQRSNKIQLGSRVTFDERTELCSFINTKKKIGFSLKRNCCKDINLSINSIFNLTDLKKFSSQNIGFGVSIKTKL